MNVVKVDRLRGIIQATTEKTAAYLDLVPVEGGFELHCGGTALESARGGIRVFKSIDAAYKYVCDYLVFPESKNVVEVRVRATCSSASLV